MKVLVYKRTHTGDPNAAGCFGVKDCMGRVRCWSFDAVIGVGGIGAEPRSYGIDGRVTWIGIGARPGEFFRRGPLVTFDRFVLLDAEGPSFQALAPRLAAHVYGANVRATIVDDSDPEVSRILDLLRGSTPVSATAQPPTPVEPTRRRRGCG